MQAQMIVVLFLLAVALIVAWAILVIVREARRLTRSTVEATRTIQRVQREQDLLAQGYIPEFAVCDECDDVMRRYLAGEDIPLRWRHPS